MRRTSTCSNTPLFNCVDMARDGFWEGFEDMRAEALGFCWRAARGDGFNMGGLWRYLLPLWLCPPLFKRLLVKKGNEND